MQDMFRMHRTLYCVLGTLYLYLYRIELQATDI